MVDALCRKLHNGADAGRLRLPVLAGSGCQQEESRDIPRLRRRRRARGAVYDVRRDGPEDVRAGTRWLEQPPLRCQVDMKLRYASGCVVECRISNREVAGSNLGRGYFAPRSITQPSIPPGFFADERVVVQVKL